MGLEVWGLGSKTGAWFRARASFSLRGCISSYGFWLNPGYWPQGVRAQVFGGLR